MSLPSSPAPEVDPTVFMFATTFGSRAQLAALLKISSDEVTAKELAKHLFGFLHRSQPYRVYPLYQALPGVAGQPLEDVLACFYRAIQAGETAMTERDIASFLRVPNRMLAWATPLEVLLGHRLYDAPLEREAAWLFHQLPALRLDAVLGAARDELQHWRAM